MHNPALPTGSEEKAQSQAREREIEDDNSVRNCRRRRQVSANQREQTTILPGIVEREKKRASESDSVDDDSARNCRLEDTEREPETEDENSARNCRGRVIL